jgi:hypothetical protein
MRRSEKRYEVARLSGTNTTLKKALIFVGTLLVISIPLLIYTVVDLELRTVDVEDSTKWNTWVCQVLSPLSVEMMWKS